LVPPIVRRKNQWGCVMANSQAELMANNQAKLMYPGLAGFYENMLPIAETFVRIVIGVLFVMHVSVKLTAGPNAVAASVFAKNGLEPAILWAYVIIFLELVGGICLIIGLFTRFFAAALAIEMLVALLVVHLPKGYAASGGGYEYVLLIGAACFLFAIRGGGPYSFDRIIGREL
jgi:putative oxidoreductase